MHFCPRTTKHEVRDYVDATDLEVGLPMVDSGGREIPDRLVNISTSVHLTKDKSGNPLEMEFGLSVYKDHQTAVLQEMPERAPVGQLPRSVDLVLDHDLVDRVKPGDRVRVTGIYQALATQSSRQSFTDGYFKTMLLVNDIQVLGNETGASSLVFSADDVRDIRRLSRRDNVLTVLAESVASSVFGHRNVKKALILQLLSGCEKNLPNGTHLRGDINVLLVGDPSTAKSQLLRAAMKIAPLAVSTTGKGSSGVGLTTAITSDPDTKERRLEAGAMVLADRGLICIDEFDKMAEYDRVAIHEAMEQQTVTINKAGIHASLNARCSVLAAANPVYGHYDLRRTIQENVGLPDSLLSRFGMLFVVLDRMDPVLDRRIATHVVQAHRYRPDGPGDKDQEEEEEEDPDDEEENGPVGVRDANRTVWTRSHVYGGQNLESESEENGPERVLRRDFLRKYLHFARARIEPYLSDEAKAAISARYVEMRGRQDRRTLPITVRTLETLIRLSTAHAKARLSNVVELHPDVAAATDVLTYALYNDVRSTGGDGERENKRKRSNDGQSDNENENKNADRNENENDNQKLRNLMLRIWCHLCKEMGHMEISKVCPDVTDQNEVGEALAQMEKEGRVMIDDGQIFQI